jgi:hypothetical protein
VSESKDKNKATFEKPTAKQSDDGRFTQGAKDRPVTKPVQNKGSSEKK